MSGGAPAGLSPKQRLGTSVSDRLNLVGRPDVRLMSLMDHSPGQRQFRDEGKLRDYYRRKGAA